MHVVTETLGGSMYILIENKECDQQKMGVLHYPAPQVKPV